MKLVFPLVAALTLCSCTWFKKKALLAPTTPPSFAVVRDRRLDELSGIAASPDQPGIFFVHNDSGDSSRFFAIGPDGALKAIFHFKGEPTARLGVRDVEDIAIGPGPDSGANYIYLGDIGDNNAQRGFVTVYRIKEPIVTGAAGAISSADVPHFELTADPLYLNYPDGARDAETLMIDPLLRQLYIVSKREDSVHVYSTPLDFSPRVTRTLVRNANLHFPGLDKWITAGDISRKGDQILIKSYTGVFYWRRRLSRASDSPDPRRARISPDPNRPPNSPDLHKPPKSADPRVLAGDNTGNNTDTPGRPEPVWMALQRPWTLQPYEPEPQGEAIGFSPDGKSFYTISEGRHPRLYHYPLH
ncbi:MAG: hypothetical protein JST42_02040 [Bacteroidetes bacterium]|nr:hypothetical protein [Bacteroidota bacterium]